MNIHENIRRLRKEKNLTMEELAKMIGTTKQTISKYETGVITNIPYDRIEKFSNIFNVTPGELMGWKKPIADKGKDDAELLLLYNQLSDENKCIIKEMTRMLVTKPNKEE